MTSDRTIDPSRIPEGLTCPRCGYSLAGLALGPCPECGRDCSIADLEHLQQRRDLESSLPRVAITAALIWLFVLAVIATEAWLLTHRVQAVVGYVVWAGLWILIAAAAGAASTRVEEPDRRRAALVLWLRGQWWLHAPWLCVPLLIPLLALIVQVARIEGSGPEGAMVMFTMLVAGLWIVLNYTCAWAWADSWRRERIRTGIASRRTSIIGLSLALATLFVSMATGFIAGIAVTGAFGV